MPDCLEKARVRLAYSEDELLAAGAITVDSADEEAAYRVGDPAWWVGKADSDGNGLPLMVAGAPFLVCEWPWREATAEELADVVAECDCARCAGMHRHV